MVWEETIILLPPQCHYVFLSATIPNAMEFAEWICKIKQQPCHVVYTDFRPTPLQHYLFPEGGNGLHLVVDEKGQFREDNFKKAVLALEEAGGGSAGKKRKDTGPKAQPKGLPASDISTGRCCCHFIYAQIGYDIRYWHSCKTTAVVNGKS